MDKIIKNNNSVLLHEIIALLLMNISTLFHNADPGIWILNLLSLGILAAVLSRSNWCNMSARCVTFYEVLL